MKPWQMTLESAVMRRFEIVWSYSASGFEAVLELLNARRGPE